MDKRKQRDFQAGLSAEVDAFLRGEPTRREFIRKFGEMAGMLAVAGRRLAAATSSAAHRPGQRSSSPIPARRSARRRPAAVKASTEGPADGSAYRAVAGGEEVTGRQRST